MERSLLGVATNEAKRVKSFSAHARVALLVQCVQEFG
jgi:hypothetical protein